MYTVKRYKTGDEIARIILNDTVLVQYASSPCYAIIDGNGKLSVTVNRLTGKSQQEIFSSKSAAQQQANWHNQQEL